MEKNNDKFIKKVNVNEIIIPNKITVYVCCYWNYDGSISFNVPTEEKKWQENYAVKMSKYSEHTTIYCFEIEKPNFKKI